MTHWTLYVILTFAGYLTTDKIEGFSSRIECERAAGQLQFPVGGQVRLNCVEIR